MIHIIKQGKLPEKKNYQRTCLNCDTIFTYQDEDLHLDPREGDYVKCPTCGLLINHNFAMGQTSDE
jgi:predicted Zn finger-like uncharacterized protein